MWSPKKIMIKKDNENQVSLDKNPEEKDIDESDEIDGTEEKVKSSKEIIEKLEEKFLRAQAEMQNVRRTSQIEVTKARLYGSEGLVKDFLPSIDNLFRTLEHQDKKNKTIPAEGIELIVREFVSALEKNGIHSIDPEGEEFNPEEHQAISVSEEKDLEPNICLEVVQKGYKFKDRIIRPAMVIVTKK